MRQIPSSIFGRSVAANTVPKEESPVQEEVKETKEEVVTEPEAKEDGSGRS